MRTCGGGGGELGGRDCGRLAPDRQDDGLPRKPGQRCHDNPRGRGSVQLPAGASTDHHRHAAVEAELGIAVRSVDGPAKAAELEPERGFVDPRRRRELGTEDPTPMRRKPRSGPNPSPWRRANSTAARQSAWTPSCCGVSRQRRSPATKITGTLSRPRARSLEAAAPRRVSYRRRRRSSICTPAAIRSGEPAKTSPRTEPITARTTNPSAPRWTRTRVEVFRLRRARARAESARDSATTKAGV